VKNREIHGINKLLANIEEKSKVQKTVTNIIA
jgi:hypothetical protein